MITFDPNKHAHLFPVFFIFASLLPYFYSLMCVCSKVTVNVCVCVSVCYFFSVYTSQVAFLLLVLCVCLWKEGEERAAPDLFINLQSHCNHPHLTQPVLSLCFLISAYSRTTINPLIR